MACMFGCVCLPGENQSILRDFVNDHARENRRRHCNSSSASALYSSPSVSQSNHPSMRHGAGAFVRVFMSHRDEINPHTRIDAFAQSEVRLPCSRLQVFCWCSLILPLFFSLSLSLNYCNYGLLLLPFMLARLWPPSRRCRIGFHPIRDQRRESPMFARVH